jgi:hypothetical protein
MTSPQSHFNHYPVQAQQQQQQQRQHHSQQPPPPIIDDEAVAAADKEMEERANRAKELLSQRYDSIRQHQVRKKSSCTALS